MSINHLLERAIHEVVQECIRNGVSPRTFLRLVEAEWDIALADLRREVKTEWEKIIQG